MMTPALKRELAAMFELPPEALDDIVSWDDHRNDCRVFQQGTAQVRISFHALMGLSPLPDPFTEAFTVVALALHEARKRAVPTS